jgi:hypothetical protein
MIHKIFLNRFNFFDLNICCIVLPCKIVLKNSHKNIIFKKKIFLILLNNEKY